MNYNFKFCNEYKDCFNIYNLIKKINPNYKLYFDNFNKRFLIVNSAKNNEICLNFNNLKQNILKLLNLTKVENSNTIYKFIDESNKNLINHEIKNKLELLKTKSSELKYFNSRSLKIDTHNLKNYIEENI